MDGQTHICGSRVALECSVNITDFLQKRTNHFIKYDLEMKAWILFVYCSGIFWRRMAIISHHSIGQAL